MMHKNKKMAQQNDGKMKMTLKIILLLVVFANMSYSQNCYIKLSDATGIDMLDYQSDLEAKACELQQAFPTEYQNQFKVYDFGFYSLNEYMQGGFNAVMEKMKTTTISQSNFYLIFGRQLPDSQGKTKVWIDFVIPNPSNFDCIEEEDIAPMKLQIQQIGNATDSPYDWANTEIEAMEFLKQKIVCSEICDNGIDDDKDGWVDCNDPDCIEQQRLQGKSRTICVGQAVFRENLNQNFGFDDNKIESYPTYNTPLGDGVPWKSLGIGAQDQVNVEFSDQLFLGDLSYVATGVEIIGSTTPQNYSETITIKGNSLTENAKIEVKDIDGNTIGGLMIKVLPAKSMILNLVLMKLPEDTDYPTVNFSVSEMETVLNNCFKQVNMTWAVNQIDQYEYNFDLNYTTKLDGNEDWDIIANYLRINHEDLYTSRYYPSEDPPLYQSTSTYILYDQIQSPSGGQTNGWTRSGDIYGVVNCSYQHNKRTMAHENGHRVGYEHPWEEFSEYTAFDDADALMDYVNILTGYKIRAYQWTN
jgi:hypothetical protein